MTLHKEGIKILRNEILIFTLVNYITYWNSEVLFWFFDQRGLSVPGTFIARERSPLRICPGRVDFEAGKARTATNLLVSGGG